MGGFRKAATLVLSTVGLAGASGCSSDRPFIATRGSDLVDLYARGELTDVQGNRWNVRPLPGVVNAVEHGGEAFSDAAEIAAHLGRASFYETTFEVAGDGMTAGVELGVEDLIGGIPGALSRNSEAIGALARETPFGWILRIGGRVVWGYALEPVGRVVLGAGAAAGGIAFGVLTPPVALVGTPTVAVGYAGIMGVARPVTEVVVTQPVYLAAILNREPSVERDADGWMIELAEPAVIVEPEAPAPLQAPLSAPHRAERRATPPTTAASASASVPGSGTAGPVSTTMYAGAPISRESK